MTVAPNNKWTYSIGQYEIKSEDGRRCTFMRVDDKGKRIYALVSESATGEREMSLKFHADSGRIRLDCKRYRGAFLPSTTKGMTKEIAGAYKIVKGALS